MDFLLDHEEENEPSKDPRIHAIAGACAGLMEHCGMFPIDTVKTHQQVFGAQKISTTVRSIVQKNGVAGLFRGMPVVLGAVAPVHGIAFSIYEATKGLTGANAPKSSPLAPAFAGIVATLTHDACITPVDTIKQRLQFGGKPYRGVFDCIRQILHKEGVGALYRGYTTTISMNIPYAAVYYGTYESVKKFLKQQLQRFYQSRNTNNSDQHKRKQFHQSCSHMMAGAIAGCLAGGITNPLDVSKTRLQVGVDTGGSYKGMRTTLRKIWMEEGIYGYTRGIRARMLFHSASASICWTTYEYVKFTLERIFYFDKELAQRDPPS